MTKPKWEDKWQALLDMKNARHAAQKTTLGDILMEELSASDVSTQSEEMHRRVVSRQQMSELLNRIEAQYFQNPFQSTYEDMDSPYTRSVRTMAIGNPTESNSSSSMTEKTESLAVFKQGTLTVLGQ